MSIDIINPADGTALATYTMRSRGELDDILESTSRAFHAWGIREFVNVKSVYVA